ncbi:MAG TPA: aminotransferase class V-fold PLP-dependent enzyme [Opitutaceae bacterium]|nr:aminotransferase class V-fold PLP-dependent enzyme [Opitutaceae bacterium]
MEPTTVFKIATTADEFEQIHRLNYQTFVGEIPQHAPNPEGRLVDKFHAENTYLIGVRGGNVIAMMAVRRRRPFSLDAKVTDLDRWLPPGRRAVEVRLFAVLPAYRNGPVASQLLRFTTRYCLDRGDDIAVISGAVRRMSLYRALGFESFGPRVGTAEAPYQPMTLTLENFARVAEARRGLHGAAGDLVPPPSPLNLLPGPVATSAAVQAAFAKPAVSHRAPEFVDQMSALRRRLAALANANDVQVLVGSGSLANDVVAAQLAGLGRPGVVVSSGEFGERLADHARRAGLEFNWVRLPWGAIPTAADIEDGIRRAKSPAWLWMAHHETSTGVLHDLEMIKGLAKAHRCHLCLDCISSLGAVPVNLEDVFLATASSGKALAGYPGLGIVFHQEPPVQRPDLPRYLDLGFWASSDGVPFTHSSNLIRALDMALAEVERLPAGRCGDGSLGAWFRSELKAAGFTLKAEEPHASPIIVTAVLPPSVRAQEVGDSLEQRGYLTSYRSGYLAARNWIQFSLMTAPPREALAEMIGHIRDLVAPPASRAEAV